jgi:nucleoid-associated protein YgaU
MVQKGDSLSLIAREFYGDMSLYPKIFEANRHPGRSGQDQAWPETADSIGEHEHAHEIPDAGLCVANLLVVGACGAGRGRWPPPPLRPRPVAQQKQAAAAAAQQAQAAASAEWATPVPTCRK